VKCRKRLSSEVKLCKHLNYFPACVSAYIRKALLMSYSHTRDINNVELELSMSFIYNYMHGYLVYAEQ